MKYLVIIIALYSGYWYVAKRYEFHDTLVYAKKNPQASWAPATNYYVGFLYYQRSEFAKAEEAFNQLLTDQPKSKYRREALFYYEDSAEQNRNWEKAKELAAAYIEEFPDGKHTEIVRKRLDKMNVQHASPSQ